MKGASARPTAEDPRRTTMLGLVQSLAQRGTSEHEIVALVLDLVESGRVVLIGNFRGLTLRDPGDRGE
jgi:hypothetical protein